MWSAVTSVPVLAALLVPASTPAPAPAAPDGPTVVHAALAVLHAWDAARGAAYAAGDPARLAALYTPGSSAGAGDVAALSAYAAHGWRITSVTTQLRAIQVLAHEPGRWRLRTTDRVRGIADTPQRCRPLPPGRYGTRDLVLVRAPSGWVVAAVSRAPSRAPR